MTQGRLFDEPAPAQRRASRPEHFVPRDESPAEVLAGEHRAATQERVILDWFRARVARDMKTLVERDGCQLRYTPSQIVYSFEIEHSIETWQHWPLTSIRRAMTMLTKRGLLVKHPDDRRMGPRGSKECTWSLR